MGYDDFSEPGADLLFWTAVDTAARVRAGEVSAGEVIGAHLARLADVNPAINAVTRLDPRALEDAAAIDRAVAAGRDPGPLAGVPVTIKDNVDVAGQSSPNGLVALDTVIATADAPLVTNLRAGGAVVIGRTNTPEFSWRWHTDNPLFGPTVNPTAPELTPGGSSGGAAAALAAGIGSLAHGNDAGGSLRWPAACTGTAALRPTMGRVPSNNSTAAAERSPAIDLMAVQGPMARTVADLALALGVMSQPDGRDPSYVPAPVLGKHRFRAGWCLGAGPEPHPAVVSAVESAVGALSQGGWTTQPVDPPDLPDAARGWATLMNTDFHQAGGARPLREVMLELGSPAIAHMLAAFDRAGPPVDLPGYLQLLADRGALLRRWQQLLTDEIDVLVLPVAMEPAWKADDDMSSEARLDEIFAANAPLVAFNFLGLPSVAVPVVTTSDRPTGVQVVAGRFAEGVALGAAQAIETELGEPNRAAL